MPGVMRGAGAMVIQLHAMTVEGISIDGLGPFPDPTGCGFGLLLP